MAVVGLNVTVIATPESDAPNNKLELFAEQTLDHFEVTAEKAERELAADRPISADALAIINTATSERALANLATMATERRSDLVRLCSEPAIARLLIIDEADRLRTVYIVRGVPPRPEPNGPMVASYRSPIGRLASARLGADIEIRTPTGFKAYELLERAALRPTRRGGTWDADNTVLEGKATAPITIISLRALLAEAQKSGDAQLQDDADILSALLNEDQTDQNVFEGRRRSVIDKMGLRDQPLLDQYQDLIFRLPLDTRLAILGPPGSGKTTTLIKRLGLKLDTAHLEDDERSLVSNSVAGNGAHATSWLMFTPNELLKLYIREAFAREGIPAPDHRIQTWDDYRREIARQRLGILRTATGSGAILRDRLQNLKDSTLASQIDWFEDFASWNAAATTAEMAEYAKRLAETPDPRIRGLGTSLNELLNNRGTGIDPGTLLRLIQQGRLISSLAKEIRDTIEIRLREALSRELRRDRELLDNLLAFSAGLSEVPDETDDPDNEEEEEANYRRGSREEAFEIFKKAARSQARAAVAGRSVGRRTRNGRIIEWLGSRSLEEGELREIGHNLQVLDAFRKFANPVALHLDRIPIRYRQFRRERQAAGIWYTDTAFQTLELSPLEVDVIALAMLRLGTSLLGDRRTKHLADEPRHSVLASIKASYRSQILVDEATDFSPVQLACMAELCDPAVQSFLACGDFNQRLTRWGSRTVDDLRWVFSDIDIRSIVVTYRHSRQLRDFAAQLALLSGDDGEQAQMPPHAVGEGFAPVLGTGLAGTALADWLADRILEIERITRKLPSIAVLVNGEECVQDLATDLNILLSSHNIRCTACSNGQIRGQENDVRVFDVQHIKGLEFEAVFFVSVDEFAIHHPDLFDKYLYVGATRAATYLGLSCTGPDLPSRLSPLAAMFEPDWR